MDLKKLKQNWETFARHDAMWAILTDPKKRQNKWLAEDFFKTGVVEIDSIIKTIKTHGYQLGGQNALDFGCGIGRLTQALANYFEHCYGIDISTEMVEQAKRYNQHGSHCQYIVNQSDALPIFNDDFFDFIYSNIVLQHIERKYTESYLKEFIRILKPDGLLVFQIPGTKSPDYDVLAKSDVSVRKRRLIARMCNMILKRLPIKKETLYSLGLSGSPAIMEMHCFERSELEDHLRKHGGVILNVERYDAAGPAFISYRYYVTKSRLSK